MRPLTKCVIFAHERIQYLRNCVSLEEVLYSRHGVQLDGVGGGVLIDGRGGRGGGDAFRV